MNGNTPMNVEPKIVPIHRFASASSRPTYGGSSGTRPLSRQTPLDIARTNQKCRRATRSIERAIDALSARGMAAIGFQFSIPIPATLHVRSCEACHDLIEQGEAAYYFEGIEDGKRIRKGQFHLHGVRVIWIETSPM